MPLSWCYNYRHSQLRNIIERAFGVVKHRFTILRGYMPFPFETLVKIVLSCFLLHNFIHREDKADLLEDLEDELEENEEAEDQFVNQVQASEEDDDDDDEAEETYRGVELSQEQKKAIADQMRINIANSM